MIQSGELVSQLAELRNGSDDSFYLLECRYDKFGCARLQTVSNFDWMFWLYAWAPL